MSSTDEKRMWLPVPRTLLTSWEPLLAPSPFPPGFTDTFLLLGETQESSLDLIDIAGWSLALKILLFESHNPLASFHPYLCLLMRFPPILLNTLVSKSVIVLPYFLFSLVELQGPGHSLSDTRPQMLCPRVRKIIPGPVSSAAPALVSPPSPRSSV